MALIDKQMVTLAGSRDGEDGEVREVLEMKCGL